MMVESVNSEYTPISISASTSGTEKRDAFLFQKPKLDFQPAFCPAENTYYIPFLTIQKESVTFFLTIATMKFF